jgi:hypothetical protein
MTLLSMVVVGLALTTQSWATETTPVPSLDPVWERLTQTEVPDDALRRFGNTSPPTATAARRSWLRVQGRLKQAHAHLKIGRASTTSDELAEDRRAVNMIMSGNPIVCRARYADRWISGLLSPSAEYCILNVSQGGEEEADCMRYRRMGPQCRPHLSVVDQEVYILRHASRLHMIHLEDEMDDLAYPHGGLVSVDDAVFQGAEPLCLFGDSRSAPLGVLSQDGTTLRCRSAVIGSEEPGSMSFGYGNLDVFAGLELRSLATHLDVRAQELSTLEAIPESLTDIAAARAAIERLDEGLVAVRGQLDEELQQVDPGLRARGQELIEERLGETLSKLDAHKALITDRLTSMEIQQETQAFIQAQVEPLMPEITEATRERAKPLKAEAARVELNVLLELTERRSRLTSLVAAELPVRSRQGALDRIAMMLGEHDVALAARLEVVSHLAIDLAERSRINQVAEAATVLLANITAEEKTPEKAQKLYDGLLDQRGLVTRSLAHEEPNPVLVKHALDTLEPILKRLQVKLDELEPNLPAKARTKVLERSLAAQWSEANDAKDSWEVVGLVSGMLPEMERLVHAEDGVSVQMDAVRRWTELRQDVLEHIQAQLRGHAQVADAEDGRHEFRKALLGLPEGKAKASTAGGARLAKLLRTNGFAWTRPRFESKSSIKNDGVTLPVIYVSDWWRAAKIRPTYDPTVTAWTRCSDAIAADWSGSHTYLKTCNRVFRKHGDSEAIRELAADIHKELEGLHESVSWNECVNLRWKHPRAFFVPTVKDQCQLIKKREKRQRAIGKAKIEIQQYVAKKNFRYARMLLSKLRKAGAERWEVANATTTIDTAERFETDRKAKKLAGQRAKALMSQMPTIERTCQEERKSWRYADNEFVRAVRNGEADRASRYETKKQRFVERGCEAKKKMSEVVAIYESQGRPVAAQSLVEDGQSCFRSWTCEDAASVR